MAAPADQLMKLSEVLSLAFRSDQCLEGDGCSSVEGLEAQHHPLESDGGRNRKPVEVTQETGHMGEFGKIENKAHCSILDTMQ